MSHRNFKMIGYVVYGRGSFNQLDEIIKPHRKIGSPVIFLVDHFFEGKELVKRIPVNGNDKIIFVDVTYEPKTKYVDSLTNQLKDEFGTVSGVHWYWRRICYGSCKSSFIDDEQSRQQRRLPGMGPGETTRVFIKLVSLH